MDKEKHYVYVYFYKKQICRSYYKRFFFNQIYECVDNATLFETLNILNCDVIISIGDYVEEINDMYPNKKIIVYSIQDNCLLNNYILTNNNVISILEHCKLSND